VIELYSWPTPNGHKITIALEELGLAYVYHPVNIGRGEQFDPAFLAIAPNNRIPAIVDTAPADGGAPVSLFESGAILRYLAGKCGALGGDGLRGRAEVDQWLAWQVAGLGPMAGQCHHFRQYAPVRISYGVDRYTTEVRRLHGVMDRRLADRDYLAGDYSIADIAAWPWVRPWRKQGQDLDAHPNLARWYHAIAARPAVVRALEVGAADQAPLDATARAILFGTR
jgi:GST-like protein